MKSVHSPKAFSSQFVADKRCCGQEADEIQVVYEGGVTYESKVIDTVIVHHVSHRVFELVIFVPDRSKVWARFYFPKDAVFAKLEGEDFDRILEEKKEFFRRRHRHFAIETLQRTAKYEAVENLILSLFPDLLSFDLSVRLQNSSTNIVYDIFQRAISFQVFNFEPLTMIAPKPELLVEVNVEVATREKSFEEYVLRERARNLIKNGVRNFENTWSRRIQPTAPSTVISTVPRSPTHRNRVQTASAAGAVNRRGLISNLRASISRRLSVTTRPSANSVLPVVEMPSSSAMFTTTTLDEDSYVSNLVRSKQGPTPKKATRRLSSFIIRRLSFAVMSFNPSTSNPGPISVSLPRYRWILAIDKVITRNLVQRFRQLQHRKLMMDQLRRVILRQRPDYADIIRAEQELAMSHDERDRCGSAETSSSTLGLLSSRNTPMSSPTLHYRDLPVRSALHNQPRSSIHHRSPPALSRQPSNFKHQPQPAPLSIKQPKSFGQALKNVRGKLLAAGGFARFQDLSVNTTAPASSNASVAYTPTPRSSNISSHHIGNHHNSNQTTTPSATYRQLRPTTAHTASSKTFSMYTATNSIATTSSTESSTVQDCSSGLLSSTSVGVTGSVTVLLGKESSPLSPRKHAASVMIH